MRCGLLSQQDLCPGYNSGKSRYKKSIGRHVRSDLRRSFMKRVLKFVAIALFAVVGSSALYAQTNPLLGTWKLNTAKSKFDPGPGPKSLTRTVVAQGDGVKYTFDGV